MASWNVIGRDGWYHHHLEDIVNFGVVGSRNFVQPNFGVEVDGTPIHDEKQLIDDVSQHYRQSSTAHFHGDQISLNELDDQYLEAYTPPRRASWEYRTASTRIARTKA